MPLDDGFVELIGKIKVPGSRPQDPFQLGNPGEQVQFTLVQLGFGLVAKGLGQRKQELA